MPPTPENLAAPRAARRQTLRRTGRAQTQQARPGRDPERAQPTASLSAKGCAAAASTPSDPARRTHALRTRRRRANLQVRRSEQRRGSAERDRRKSPQGCHPCALQPRAQNHTAGLLTAPPRSAGPAMRASAGRERRCRWQEQYAMSHCQGKTAPIGASVRRRQPCWAPARWAVLLARVLSRRGIRRGGALETELSEFCPADLLNLSETTVFQRPRR